MQPGVRGWTVALVLIGMTAVAAGATVRELKLDQVTKFSIAAIQAPFIRGPLATL